jgi:predicted MPP superfamily phosphohydrolase
MTDRSRMLMFLLIVIAVWTLMHLYVGWRLWNLPAGAGAAWHRTLLLGGILLWISFPLGQALVRNLGRAALPIELVGSSWLGVLFLLLIWLLAADLITGFGWLLPTLSAPIRRVAVIAALVLSVIALVQGFRAPVVREHTVRIPTLAPEHDGLCIVQLSDLHVGPILREGWVEARLAQVASLNPDLVVVTGDLVDQDAVLSVPLAPLFRRIEAPLGVYGVTGNHEYYAGFEQSLEVFKSAGITLLRDGAREVAPGLVIAGVDDLTARRQFRLDGQPVVRALQDRPAGTTIFLCHSPLDVERAASMGVNLMLSGHTHDGQIWPFTYFVRLAYPRVVGRYDVNGMALIVSRGTGFWGPRMRLFRRSEIVAVTLARG